MTLSMTVQGADRRLRFDWEAAAASWASEASRLAVTALKVEAPVGKGGGVGQKLGGKLRTSITSRTEQTAGVMSVLTYTTVPYAGFVIGGTRPHPIAAVSAQALHWTDASGDRFAKSVNHPGTKPNPFPERAVGPLGPALAELFAKACQEATI